MLADIVEGPDFSIGSLDAEETLAGEFKGKVIAGPLQFSGMASEPPCAGQNASGLAAEDLRVDVAARLQRMRDARVQGYFFRCLRARLHVRRLQPVRTGG